MTKSTPKSLLITLEFPPQIGGIAKYYAEFCRVLGRDRVVVETPFMASLRRLPLCWLLSVYGAYKIVRKQNIKHLFVGQILPLGYIAVILKFFLKLPYTIFVHGTDIALPLNSKWKKFWAKLILNKAHLIIANSQFTKNKVKRHYNVNKDKIKALYPPVGIRNVETPFMASGREEQDCKIILTVARLVPRKGIDMVIRALPQVLKKIPQAEYWIIGDGPDQARLSSIAQTMRLENKIKFLGVKKAQDLAKYYTQCDVFIMPSRQLKNGDYEGFGIVYLEAASFSKPVIAGNQGGAPEAVEDGQTGILVNPESSEEIARALIKLLTNQDLAQKMGERGKERVIKEFDFEKSVKKLVCYF